MNLAPACKFPIEVNKQKPGGEADHLSATTGQWEAKRMAFPSPMSWAHGYFSS